MIVGVCLTKLSEGARSWTDAFAEGVLSHGDQPIPIVEQKQLEFLGAECDVSIQVADQHYSDDDTGPLMAYSEGRPCGAFEEGIENFRAGIVHVQKKNNKPRVILDRGFVWHRDFFSICINEIKRPGLLHTANSPSDRWNKLGIPIPQWAEGGNNILVLGQNEHGQGTKTLREKGLSFLDWSNFILKEIRKHTDKKIIYKPHRMQRYKPQPVENCIVLPCFASYDILGFMVSAGEEAKMCDYLIDSWCVVSCASNGAIDSLLSGYPAITTSRDSVAYDECSHDICEINSPKRGDLTQWCNNLGYAQWNQEELKSGEAWEYIKRHFS